MANRVRPRKGGTFPLRQVELAKAVTQIAAPDLPHGGIDAVVRPVQRPLGPETAVQRELRMTQGGESAEEQKATEEEGPQGQVREHRARTLEDDHLVPFPHRDSLYPALCLSPFCGVPSLLPALSFASPSPGHQAIIPGGGS